MKIAEVLFELRNDIGIILHAADPQPVMQLSSNMGIARNIRPKTIRSGEDARHCCSSYAVSLSRFACLGKYAISGVIKPWVLWGLS